MVAQRNPALLQRHRPRPPSPRGEPGAKHVDAVHKQIQIRNRRLGAQGIRQSRRTLATRAHACASGNGDQPFVRTVGPILFPARLMFFSTCVRGNQDECVCMCVCVHVRVCLDVHSCASSTAFERGVSGTPGVKERLPCCSGWPRPAFWRPLCR